MKTPSFWKNKTLLSTALLPAGWIYAGLTALRLKLKKPYHTAIPVICVGNLTAGGSGKTPTAVSLAKILKHSGKNPFFVSRGYGGRLQNVIVDSERHTAADTGDEPLLLSREAPVALNADRGKAAVLALQNGADVIIMDDGFQNPTLHKDLSFLIIDGGFGFGNGRPVPAGPLRENLDKGLARADAAVIIGDDQCGVRSLLGDLPVFEGRICPEPVPDSQNIKAIAFAGIGRPGKFYASLKECGVNIIATHDFPDHHFYTKDELQKLMNEAQEKSAVLYTTAKDFVKIPAALRPHFRVLEISIKWKDEAALADFVLSRI
ncbi:MAG: tetraacyldisaccharide 4'-kinase [Pseudomonadota bacterium]|nr:tetraacyldisaccharide 4'-kinase [Pseudomonadota bacterium]